MDNKPQSQDKAKELIYDTPEYEKAFKEGRVFLEDRYDPVKGKSIHMVKPIAEYPSIDPLIRDINAVKAYGEGWVILVSSYDPTEHEHISSSRLVEDGSLLLCVDCHQEFLFTRKELQHYKLQGEPTLTRCPSCRKFHKTRSASKTTTSSGEDKKKNLMPEGFGNCSGQQRLVKRRQTQ